jgi:GntR family transcriptional regulator/MocR family aminotransferase
MHLDGKGQLSGQVYRALRDTIVRGGLAEGARAPATRTLALELGVSRTTVLAAYEQLAAEGYLASRHGSGHYVQGSVPVTKAGPFRRAAPPRLSAVAERVVASRRLPVESAYASGRPRLRWDFRYGLPAIADFPLAAWHRTLGRRARRAAVSAFDYGPPQGSPALRQALAGYLARARGIVCDPEQIVIVTGSQQGLDLVARTLLDPGQHAVVEEPAFEGARNAMVATGARVHAVPADADGIDTSRLGALPSVRLACVTPAHQFPLGGVLSWGRRAALLAWARETGAWVVEDDYDGEFRYDGRPIAPLRALDDERVLYLGTFSKVMFPSLRLGYLVVPPALVDAVTRMKLVADAGSARLEQEALADFIASGQFERHVRRARVRGAARRAALVSALARLGDRVEVVGANAGLHLVCWLPGRSGRETRQIVERAAGAGVGVYAITPHYVTPPTVVGLILGYAGVRERDIAPGVAALGRVLDRN